MNRGNLSSIRERLGLWLVIGLVLLLILGGWAAIGRGYRTNEDLRNHLLQQAMDIAQTIDPVLVSSLTFAPTDKDSWAYQQIRGQMATYGKFINQQSIYTLSIRNGAIVYGPDSNATDDAHAVPPGTIYANPAPAIWQVFTTGKSTTYSFHSNDRGTFVSAYAPIIGPRTNEVVMVVAIDIPVNEWIESIWSSSLPVILVTLILAAIVLSGLIAVKRRNRLPLDQQRQWVYLEAIFVAIFGMALTVSISMLVMESEARDRRSILGRVASTNSTQVTTAFREVERKFSALERFYVGSDVVTRQEFAIFAWPLVENSTPQSFGWIPQVYEQDLPAYEQEIRHQGIRNFAIWELDTNGERQPVSSRSIHYPVELIISGNSEIADLNESTALGFDMGSEPLRLAALEQAQSSELVAATDPLKLINGEGLTTDILAFHPVFAVPNVDVDSIAGEIGTRRLLGFVMALMRVQSILDRLLRDEISSDDGVTVGVIDLTVTSTNGATADESAPLILGTYPSGEMLDDAAVAMGVNRRSYWRTNGAYVISPLFALGRAYGIITHANDGFYAQYPMRTTWLAAVTGLFLTSVMTLTVALLRSRQTFLEQEVREHSEAQVRSEVSNRSIVQAIPDIIMRFNRAGVISGNFDLLCRQSLCRHGEIIR